VLGSDRNNRRETWYKVRLVDEDGVIREGWIRSDLIESDEVIPTLGPTPTPTETSTPGGSPPPFTTATSEAPGTPIVFGSVTPSAELSDVNIWAYCAVYNGRILNEGARQATSDQTVSIQWSWFVTRPELMQDHLDAVDYDVRLNGRRLENWQQYRTEMRRDARNNNNWTIYWYLPVGKLAPGEYTVEYKATWSKVVNDGLKDYGPGTDSPEDVGSCTFTVTEP
jgi:hypothetical protein